MIKYLITGDELSALYGRSWLAQLIYLRALRPYMDYATGIIGRARKISYQSIAEELERDTRRGRHTDCSGPPTLKEVRCALEELELVLDPELPPDDRRPALLRRISADRQLVFEALMAPRDSSASGMRGRRRADVGQTMKGTEETSDDAVSSDMKGRRRADPDVPMTGTHPESVLSNTPHHARARAKQPLNEDWQPSERCYQSIEKAGISRSFADQCIDEFIIYWTDSREKRASWDATFINRVKAEWARVNKNPAGDATSAPGQAPSKPRERDSTHGNHNRPLGRGERTERQFKRQLESLERALAEEAQEELDRGAVDQAPCDLRSEVVRLLPRRHNGSG